MQKNEKWSFTIKLDHSIQYHSEFKDGTEDMEDQSISSELVKIILPSYKHAESIQCRVSGAKKEEQDVQCQRRATNYVGNLMGTGLGNLPQCHDKIL